MKSYHLIAACAAAVVAVNPALAQEAQSPEGASEGDVNANTRVVCRRVDAPTGSRIGTRRICRTQHQWDLVNRETRDVVEEAFNRSKVSSGN